MSQIPNNRRCKYDEVWRGHLASSRCSRKAVKDGYCKQHHPDTVKARREANRKRFEEKMSRDPIIVASELIRRLESERDQLMEDRRELMNALGALSPWQVGSGMSMDHHLYSEAWRKARSLIAKIKAREDGDDK